MENLNFVCGNAKSQRHLVLKVTQLLMMSSFFIPNSLCTQSVPLRFFSFVVALIQMFMVSIHPLVIWLVSTLRTLHIRTI